MSGLFSSQAQALYLHLELVGEEFRPAPDFCRSWGPLLFLGENQSMDEAVPMSAGAIGLTGPRVLGTSSALGERQMVEQTRLLIQPNCGNRCLKMLVFMLKLLALLDEPGGRGTFVK